MKKNKKIIVGNWKMNPKNIAVAEKIFTGIKKVFSRSKNLNIIICPPFPYIKTFNADLPSGMFLGTQNVSAESIGAFTGEVASSMAKSVGAVYTIVGHSERRAMGETNESVNKKVMQALLAKLSVILCVGERERDSDGRYLSFLKDQIKNSLAKIPKKALSQIIIAYEPVWAIGKKDTEAMKGRDVHEMLIFIRKTLSDMYGGESGAKVPILYGGSVTPLNTGEIVGEGNVDGLLVGRQSLVPESFGEILSIVSRI
ncbi:MAG: triose-phosphate isomerase [Parcubacteria group bacterium]|nr:triose-phosphate isomerase [Parcubacteria group bacterium]